MSYLIPKDELSLSEMRNFREGAESAGIKRCAKKLGVSEGSLVVRPFENILDIPAIALNQWNTAALVAPLGGAITVFQAIAAPTLAANKLVVFYKVMCETVPVPIAMVTFRLGGAAGNVIAEFDFEQVICSTSLEGYFTQPVCIDPTTTFAVQVQVRIVTNVFARVQFGAVVIEPIGMTIA